MPERKSSPQNFDEMLNALKAGFNEDAESVFSMSDAEVDDRLAEEGIDPAPALEKVQKIIAASYVKSQEKVSGSKTNRPKVFLSHSKHFWQHPSILALHTEDPVNYICEYASMIVLNAVSAGWTGPPFDPASLVKYMDLGVNIGLVPKADVSDARIVPVAERQLQVEFNPTKPKARIRFSIAHELAHALFPDCEKAIRNRLSHREQHGYDWQLETLCNLAAAEFLMPTGHFPELKSAELSIRVALELRKRFEVSTEAVLLRIARLTEIPCAIFAASEREQGRFSLEYAVPSRGWHVSLPSGTKLPQQTRLKECNVLGYTAVGEEEWLPDLGPLEVQGVRISPFPGESVPRVVGFVRPKCAETAPSGRINYLSGDATAPRGQGHRIIAHVVNDKTPNWGAGFARAVQVKWPEVQQAFKSWSLRSSRALALGNTFHSDVVDEKLTVVQMICQHGYGRSINPRIRYASLKICLEKLASFALQQKRDVHMPKIGAGEAGGSWKLIEQMIDEVLCAQGVDVTIYELPDDPGPRKPQRDLFA